MSFSLDTMTATSLKAEARLLREERAGAGEPITHGAALEMVARAHGFRDWNTARAALPERVATPVQVGERVHGTYLGQPFKGLVIGMNLMTDMQHYQVTVKFDDPVNVSRSKLFDAFRQRVTATVDVYGVTPARTGDGHPQMRIERM